MRIKMCSIPVDDAAGAFAFYTGTLGFEQLLAVEEAQLYVVRAPQEPSGPGLLLEPAENEAARRYKESLRAAGVPVIVLGSADVRAEHERLRAAGVVFTGEPTSDESGTHATFDDGFGNFVQIHQD